VSATVVAVLGCGGSTATKKPTSAGARSANSTNPTTSPAKRIIIPDESLQADEYVKRGMPAHDRPWIGDDLTAASRTLASIAQSGYGRLPRRDSDRSGSVFARMTSPKNLDLLRNKSLPLEMRLSQGTEYQKGMADILQLYGSAVVKNQIPAADALEVLASQFHVAILMFELADEMLSTIEPNDASRTGVVAGLEQMKQGLALIVMGGMSAFNERDVYTSAELMRLIEAMKATFPRLVPRLSSLSKQEALRRLETLLSDPAAEDLHPGLKEVHSNVKAVLEAPKTS
jgi:hypothetical protein